MKFGVVANTVSTNTARLAVSTSADLSSPVYGPGATASDGILRLNGPDLPPGTYFWGIERNGSIARTPRGTGKIPAASHRIAFGTCAYTGSDAEVFTTIKDSGADMFFHIGDMHYHDDPSTDPLVHIAHTEEAVSNPRQQALWNDMTCVWIMDDHDGGPDDRFGTTPATAASAEAWRKRAPHPTLSVAGVDEGHYFTFDVGRVRYVFTDQRRYASDKTSFDGPSKTVLGATQKAWFKNIIENSPGYLIVWCSSRLFHEPQRTNWDHWGSFTTERTELCDHIKLHASGRFIILTGDRHEAGIDDGTNCNYATGGDPIPICMGAPLDQATLGQYLGVFSEGVFTGGNQFGSIEVADAGGGPLNVTLAVYDSNGTELSSLPLVVDIEPLEPGEFIVAAQETGADAAAINMDLANPELTFDLAAQEIGADTAAIDMTEPAGDWTPNDLTNLIAWYDMTDNSLMTDVGSGPVTDGDSVATINNKASGATAGTHNLVHIQSSSGNVWYENGPGGGAYLDVAEGYSIGFDDAGPSAGSWHGHNEAWIFINVSTWSWHGTCMVLPDKGDFVVHAGIFDFQGRGSWGAHGGFTDVDYYLDNVLVLSNPTGAVSKETLRNAGGWFMNGDGKGIPKTLGIHIKGGLSAADTAFRLLNIATLSGGDQNLYGWFRAIVMAGPMDADERTAMQDWTVANRLANYPDPAVNVLWVESQYAAEDTQAGAPASDPVSALNTTYVGSAGPDTMVVDIEEPDLSATALMVGIGEEPEQYYPLTWDGTKYTGPWPGIQAELLAKRDVEDVVYFYYSYVPLEGETP